MSIMPTTATAPHVSELEAAILTVLAEIRQVTLAELEAQRAGGDLEMASPEAVAVIATLEQDFGRRLAQVDDLEPEQLTSVASLGDLLHRRWSAGAPLPVAGNG